MNVKNNFIEWMEAGSKYPNLNFNTILVRYCNFLDFDPFEVKDDYSNIEEIKSRILEKDHELKKNKDYNHFQLNTRNGAPRAILGNENYFAFLNETKPQTGMNKFKEIIAELENKFKQKEIFKVTDLKHNYAWIGDNKEIIGAKPAHYEVRILRGKLSVEIHFEEAQPMEFYLKYNSQIKLPKDIVWFKWGDSQSIRYKQPTDMLAVDAVEKINDQLMILEDNFGDKIRDLFGNLLIENKEKKIRMKQLPLNQILFGPPGTGKTYNTINKAIAIANPKFDLSQPRNIIKKEFERLMKEGQVVFTTFHQSMSYEDYIEGIKPLKPNQEDQYIKYDVIPGIFKKICQDAITPNLMGFDLAYENLKKELSTTEVLSLKTPTGEPFSISLNSNDNLTLHTGPNKEQQGTLTKENIQKQINGEEKFKGWEGYFEGVIENLKTKHNYSGNGSAAVKNYVLIIDEINRGNVSQIFGELITLIEEDKRIGKDEALEVTLPYSKDPFGVPSNLFIIGTMNTADRSVEAIDTALRRRFSFEEVSPKYDLNELQYDFADIKGFEILQTLNKRIEKLLDKDHQIGHSYFMKKDGDDMEEKLVISFYKNIIPLLQEYFFGDFGKIGLVIGQGFVRKKEWSKNSDSFAEFDYQSSSEFDDREVFEIIDYRIQEIKYTIKVQGAEVQMDFQKAIKLLMKQDIE